ncbi:MAG: GNAT family N-acetyltransferase [Flavobacteriaceae bacterium]|nr:GNAT family N-acetyltransferase [Candidatus Onthonaster equi]
MESDRLFFRTLTSEDIFRLFEIYSDTEAMKYRQSKPHITIEDSIQMIERDSIVRNTNYELRYGIFEKESNILIGTIMYQPLNTKAIIGYSLAKESWNKGYATEVVKFFINFLKHKNFKILEAWVLNENIASCKVLEKNHFKKISQTIYPNSSFYKLFL